MRRSLLSLVVLLSPLALAEDQTFQFRSVEDPAFPPDDSICADAPFPVNVKLGASLWSEIHRLSDGKVIVEKVVRVGRATACVELTNFLFPSGLQQNFYAVFDLPSGSYTALGTCTLSSNDVPQAGLVLAGCALKVLEAPGTVQGGIITSASTFNPAQLTGFNTGSSWTMQIYKPGGGRPHSGWSWLWNQHQDHRTPWQLEQARQRGGKRHHHP